jgi:hypothetical protein
MNHTTFFKINLLFLSFFSLISCNSEPKKERRLVEIYQPYDTVKANQNKHVVRKATYTVTSDDIANVFIKKHDIYSDDTLVLNTPSGHYEISPSGLFQISSKDTVQLETDLIVERAFLYQDQNYFYVFFTDTDHEGATSWIQKISKTLLKTEYTEQIQGFNLGQPVIQGNEAYVTAISFVGKINLETGIYDWRHYDLYDSKKYSFNSFDTVIVKNETVEFLSTHYRSKHEDKVIVDKITGKIIDLQK